MYQWLLTFLEVLSPTSPIHAFMEPFIVRKIKCAFLLKFKAYIYCISAQTGQPDCDITNHTSGVNQTAKPMKLIH